MKYQVLDRFKAITSQGEMELPEGQIITMPHDIAIRLLNESKITPIEKVAYRIYSEILEDYLWLCETDKDLHYFKEKNISEPIYTKNEIKKLKGIDKETLKAVHEVKTVFKDSKVEECKKNKNEV
jgi:hypothetical protein